MFTLIAIVVLIIFVLIILGCLLAYRFGRYIERVEQRLTALEEKSNCKRLPNKTIEGLEDAQAVLIDVAQEVQLTDLRLKQLHGILNLLRNDPLRYEYQPDGLKPEKGKP